MEGAPIVIDPDGVFSARQIRMLDADVWVSGYVAPFTRPISAIEYSNCMIHLSDAKTETSANARKSQGNCERRFHRRSRAIADELQCRASLLATEVSLGGVKEVLDALNGCEGLICDNAFRVRWQVLVSLP